MAVDFLVGCTGFVGSNLTAAHRFSGEFHSRNVAEAYGKEPDLLVYSGVPAEMFLANRDPAADWQRMEGAMENIRRIAPKEIVLISTVAVYPEPRGLDEDAPIDPTALPAYGANRLALEQWVEEHFERSLIVRLPAIFGRNLKKNFLYDFIHVIPAMLTQAKLLELSAREPRLAEFYLDQGNGFFKCRSLSEEEGEFLKNAFRTLGFTALNFTDSRSVYQFYDLSRLWDHICLARQQGLSRLNLVTPPLSTAEVYRFLTGEDFSNELSKPPFDYDLKTRHAALFGGSDGYVLTRQEVLADIRRFVKGEA